MPRLQAHGQGESLKHREPCAGKLARTALNGRGGVVIAPLDPTTVGEVREKGGDVIYTSGRSPNHATLTGLTPQQIAQLLTPTITNPNRMGDS